MTPSSVTLTDDILTISTSRIARRYRWNSGNLISEQISDPRSGHVWTLAADRPDMLLPGAMQEATDGKLTVSDIADTAMTPAYTRAEVTCRLGELEVKRVFRIYPDCPAIACDIFLRGRWPEGEGTSVLEHIASDKPHLSLTCVQFFDMTDYRNNLVQTRSITPYRLYEEKLIGNLVLLRDVLSDAGLFILKEAPCHDAQLAWPGYDVACNRVKVDLCGLGAAPQDVQPGAWTRCYGFVTGVAGGGEYALLSALRSYQGMLRLRKPERDEMILLNTWGDRGQDRRIGEAFAMGELGAAQRLGISHFQLDDGWQAGRTTNSATAGGTLTGIWGREGFWQPHPERFPRGLAPVVERGRELGIQIGLWFNPSKDNSYENWEKDAAVLIGLNRAYGVRTFKIDGVDILDKRGETNFRAMLDTVMEATGREVVFNLDITNGHRFGFHYLNEYGNLFLENRYSDVSNYYPHWTLRNLWQLARYVPAQTMQIEFLNRWRNPDKYGADDPLAPCRVPFDYCFAVTMMAQPLAWFEASHLPEDAFAAAPIVQEYRRRQAHIHSGQIFPIGDEPSGVGWTGFQSILDDNHGYLLVMREWNERPYAWLNLWNLGGRSLTCTHVLGHGDSFAGRVSHDGRLPVRLPGPFTFALYEYQAA